MEFVNYLAFFYANKGNLNNLAASGAKPCSFDIGKNHRPIKQNCYPLMFQVEYYYPIKK